MAFSIAIEITLHWQCLFVLRFTFYLRLTLFIFTTRWYDTL